MTDHSFSVSLVRKSERAIQIARLSLENEDPDSAVNRAYYAMFNISRPCSMRVFLRETFRGRTEESARPLGNMRSLPAKLMPNWRAP